MPLVTKIQRFSTHDGPGIRTVVFLKGCPLRCKWCHNPETQSAAPQIFYTAKRCIGCGACVAVCPTGAHQIDETGDTGHRFDAARCMGCGACAAACPTLAIEPVGRQMEIDDIMEAVLRDRPFYGENGGLTLSGGEPMAHPAEALELLERAKAAGISTALETCGYFDSRWVPRLAKAADLLLWDWKDSDPVRHREYTGVSNTRILDNLLALDAAGGKTRLRCIMVEGVNLDETHQNGIAKVYASLRHCEGVELLPYHPYGGSKREQLGGIDDGHAEWVPTKEALLSMKAALTQDGVPLW